MKHQELDGVALVSAGQNGAGAMHPISVFLCYTPLHALTAKAIILQENLSNVVVIYCATNRDAVCRIFSRDDVTLLVGENSLRGVLSLCLQARVSAGQAAIVFYCANYKKFITRCFLRALNPATLHVFDDGIGSIVPGSYFYSNDQSFLKRFAVGVIGGARLGYKNLMRRLSVNYTIFPEQLSVLPIPVVQVKLPELPVSSEIRTPTVVYLGSPLSEDHVTTEQQEVNVVQYVRAVAAASAARFVYLTHPRESEKKVNRILGEDAEEHVMRSEVGAELALMAAARNIVAVYGVASTTLLLLASAMPGRMHAIAVSSGGPELAPYYALLSRAGVRLIETPAPSAQGFSEYSGTQRRDEYSFPKNG